MGTNHQRIGGSGRPASFRSRADEAVGEANVVGIVVFRRRCEAFVASQHGRELSFAGTAHERFEMLLSSAADRAPALGTSRSIRYFGMVGFSSMSMDAQ